jgi:hypothetical protein
MKRILVVLLVIVVGVVAFGFYQGWFAFSTGGTDEKPNATFTIDKDKIREDEEKAKEKIKEAGETIKEKTGIGGDKSKTEESKKP